MSLPRPFHRRQVLIGGAAALAVASSPRMVRSETAAAKNIPKPVRLLAQPVGQVTRVRLEIELTGNANMAKNPLVDRKLDLQLPVRSDVVFDYEERLQRGVGRGSATQAPLVSHRYYHQAGSDTKLNKSMLGLRLREAARDCRVHAANRPETIYSETDFLTREEVDLLAAPLSSVAVDGLLPTGPVTIGSKYRPEADSVAAALNLSTVDASEIEAEVVSLDDDKAKIELAGQVDGSSEGALTSMELIGKMTFDRQARLVTWCAVAIREKREISVSQPGFDVSATVKMLRQPLPQPQKLPTDEVPIVRELPRERLLTVIESPKLGLWAMLDRRWRSMSDLAGTAVWRLSENDRSIAQCDLRALPSLAPQQEWTLDAFQKEIRKTLGDQLDKIISRERRRTTMGLDVMTVAASGVAGGVPIQWTLIHFAKPAEQTSDEEAKQASDKKQAAPRTRRVLATFTMKAEDVDAFAGSDIQLAETMRLRPLDSPVLRGEAAEAQIPSGLPGSSTRSDRSANSDNEQAKRAGKSKSSAEKSPKIGKNPGAALQS